MTDSGYPRIVKRWSRGTPLSSAVTVFEGKRTDVGVSAWVDHDVRDGVTRITEGIRRSIAFYKDETFVLRNGVPTRWLCRTTPPRRSSAVGSRAASITLEHRWPLISGRCVDRGG